MLAWSDAVDVSAPGGEDGDAYDAKNEKALKSKSDDDIRVGGGDPYVTGDVKIGSIEDDERCSKAGADKRGVAAASLAPLGSGRASDMANCDDDTLGLCISLALADLVGAAVVLALDVTTAGFVESGLTLPCRLEPDAEVRPPFTIRPGTLNLDGEVDADEAAGDVGGRAFGCEGGGVGAATTLEADVRGVLTANGFLTLLGFGAARGTGTRSEASARFRATPNIGLGSCMLWACDANKIRIFWSHVIIFQILRVI